MLKYQKEDYSIISYICCNRRHVEVVKGYEVLGGVPIWRDVEISIKLSHYGKRETTQEEIDNAIEISKIYIDNLLTNKI